MDQFIRTKNVERYRRLLERVTEESACNIQRQRKPYDGQRQDLTRDEIEKLFAALKQTRNGHRDYMIGLATFLHGLRVSELIDLRWDDIDWRAGTMRQRDCAGCSGSKTQSALTSSRQSAGKPSLGSPSTR